MEASNEDLGYMDVLGHLRDVPAGADSGEPAMITLADYFMGRRENHSLEMTPQIEKNALLTVELANTFLKAAEIAGCDVEMNPRTHSPVSSGWRPPSLNSVTPGASPRSRHMTGQAIDLYDPDGDLDNFAMSDEGQECLHELGLWLEHPSATKGWCHLQTVPPRSGKRVFYP